MDIKLKRKATCALMDTRATQLHSRLRGKVIWIEASKESEPHKNSQLGGGAYFWIGEGSQHPDWRLKLEHQLHDASLRQFPSHSWGGVPKLSHSDRCRFSIHGHTFEKSFEGHTYTLASDISIKAERPDLSHSNAAGVKRSQCKAKVHQTLLKNMPMCQQLGCQSPFYEDVKSNSSLNSMKESKI